MCPPWAMPVLWHIGLLLSLLAHSTCLEGETEEECVLGIVGHPVALPCLYDGSQLLSENFSIEWRLDSEVVLRSVWGKAGHMDLWTTYSTNSSRISSAALQTGDFSLELTTVEPKLAKRYYSLFLNISGEEESSALCTVCLRTAAAFSYPQIHREDPGDNGETVFLCHTRDGFPEPVIHWFINETEVPPTDSIKTTVVPLEGSSLFNVTSRLTVKVSLDTSVSCVIENHPMNETLTTTSFGVYPTTVVGRASEAMWVFSTVLSVAVGLMVLAALVYQIHLDRIHKKRKKEFLSQNGYKRSTEDMAVMNVEVLDSLTESNV